MTYSSIRDETLKNLKDSEMYLFENFGVDALAVFGSVARGDDGEASDVNVLYHFCENRGDLTEFIGLKNYLELMCHRVIDLIPLDYINPHYIDEVQADVQMIFDKRRVE